MMKIVIKWTVIVVLILSISTYIYILVKKTSNESIKKPSVQTVNKFFYTKVPDNSYIQEYKVASDYCLEVKLNMRVDEVDKIFSYYKKYDKVRNDDDYKLGCLPEWGLNETNYDYTISEFSGVSKSLIFGQGEVQTQRSKYIMVTKPQGGKVSVYMWVDNIGSEWKE